MFHTLFLCWCVGCMPHSIKLCRIIQGFFFNLATLLWPSNSLLPLTGCFLGAGVPVVSVLCCLCGVCVLFVCCLCAVCVHTAYNTQHRPHNTQHTPHILKRLNYLQTGSFFMSWVGQLWVAGWLLAGCWWCVFCVWSLCVFCVCSVCVL